MSVAESDVRKMMAAAAKAGDYELVVALLGRVCDVRELLRSPNARRQARHRERHKERSPDAQTRNEVTPNVTQTSAVRDAVEPSPLSHSPLSPETLSLNSSLISSSSGSSPEQGSDLEGRREPGGTYDRAWAKGLTPTEAPERLEVTPALADACRMAGAPVPTETDVAHALADARSKGTKRADWFSYLVGWQCRARTFQRARAPTAPVQPSDPRAPWLQPGYGEFGGDEA